MKWYIEFVTKSYETVKEYYETEAEALNQLRLAVSIGLAEWSDEVSDSINYRVGDMKWATLHMSL